MPTQGQTINVYIFLLNSRGLTILVSNIKFSGMPDLVVGLEITLENCVAGKIQGGRYLSEVKQYKLVSFLIY